MFCTIIVLLPARAENSFEVLNNVLPQVDHPLFVNRGLRVVLQKISLHVCLTISLDLGQHAALTGQASQDCLRKQ